MDVELLNREPIAIVALYSGLPLYAQARFSVCQKRTLVEPQMNQLLLCNTPPPWGYECNFQQPKEKVKVHARKVQFVTKFICCLFMLSYWFVVDFMFVFLLQLV